MKYSVDVYIPGKEKYSGKFEGMSDKDASEKVVNNIYIHGCNGNSVSSIDIQEEIVTLKHGENFLYWCDSVNGGYARVTAV